MNIGHILAVISTTKTKNKSFKALDANSVFSSNL